MPVGAAQLCAKFQEGKKIPKINAKNKNGLRLAPKA
jgi:hypothetical protein